MNDLSSSQYSVNNNVRFKTSMLWSDLCDYTDAYIALKGAKDLLATAANKDDKAEKDVVFKIMLHLGHAFQKLTVHWKTMQMILI